jgi:ribosomal protein L37E
MSEPSRPRPPLGPVPAPVGTSSRDPDKVLCERCGAEMYRMHAVWRCQDCGFKTDCCGW